MTKKKTIIFAPAVFNLGETTRMVEIAKEMKRTYQEKYNYLFIGFSRTYEELIIKNGFDYHLLAPVFTEKEEVQLFKADQMKTLKQPFTYERVKARLASELKIFEEFSPDMIVTGTNLTVFLSARIKEIPLVYVKPFPLTKAYLRLDSSFPPFQIRSFPFLWKWLRKLMLKLRWMPAPFKKAATDYKLKLPTYRKVIGTLSRQVRFLSTINIFQKITFKQGRLFQCPKRTCQKKSLIS